MTSLGQIAEYAQAVSARARRPGRDGWAYRSFHDAVLAHGRIFEPAQLPDDVYPALAGHACRAAAIVADQRAQIYVEGLALLPDGRTVIEHAWCADWLGRVIDPNLGGSSAAAYLGLAFPLRFRGTAPASASGPWSIMTADIEAAGPAHLELLRHGFPPGALVEIGAPLRGTTGAAGAHAKAPREAPASVSTPRDLATAA